MVLCCCNAVLKYQCFRFLDVSVAEEELAVQIRKIDGVQVNNMYLMEACGDEVLEQLTAYSTGTNDKDTSL